MSGEKDRATNRWRWLLRGVSLLMLSGVFTAQAQDIHDEAVWKWTPEQLQQRVNTVRSGKDLTPKQWPNGARVAVGLSFDFDTELA